MAVEVDAEAGTGAEAGAETEIEPETEGVDVDLEEFERAVVLLKWQFGRHRESIQALVGPHSGLD